MRRKTKAARGPYLLHLELLRDHGAKPFVALRPDPELKAEPVPLRVLRVEGLKEEGGFYVAEDRTGSVAFALPRRQHVALRVG